jgi:hypothetical protein
VPFAFDLVSWYTLVLAVLGDVLFWLAVGPRRQAIYAWGERRRAATATT